jgi:hypothetical protein
VMYSPNRYLLACRGNIGLRFAISVTRTRGAVPSLSAIFAQWMALRPLYHPAPEARREG